MYTRTKNYNTMGWYVTPKLKHEFLGIIYYKLREMSFDFFIFIQNNKKFTN